MTGHGHTRAFMVTRSFACRPSIESLVRAFYSPTLSLPRHLALRHAPPFSPGRRHTDFVKVPVCMVRWINRFRSILTSWKKPVIQSVTWAKAGVRETFARAVAVAIRLAPLLSLLANF